MSLSIRMGTPRDAADCLAIYAPIVNNTTISFEETPPSVQEMESRITKALAHSLWIVALDPEVSPQGVLGYAYASQYRARPAYDWTCETTVYVHESARSRGIGTRLYQVLLEGLRLLGYRSAMAGITLPNPTSVRLHESVGFKPAGGSREAGFKFSAWHDVGFWQVPLGDGSAPTRPRNAAALNGMPEWRDALSTLAAS